MSRRAFATILGLAILSSCQSAPAPQQQFAAAPQQAFPPAPPDPAPSVSAHRPYTLPASDIEVAMFGTIVGSISDKGVVSACGYVNAKNSYGGYAGQTPFIGVLATSTTSGQRVFVVSAMGGTSTQTMAVMMLCQRQAMAI